MEPKGHYVIETDDPAYLRVADILCRWDPIGVMNEKNRDEYDIHVPVLIRFLYETNPTSDALTGFMRRIASKHIGLTFVSKRSVRPFAEELHSFWQDWESKNLRSKS